MTKVLRSIVTVIVSLTLFITTASFAFAEDVPIANEKMNAFAASIDVDYAKNALETIRSFGTNPDLGFRNSGSSAELACRDYIASEMESFGFKVTLEPVTLDTWSFEKGSMSFKDANGADYTALLAAEQIDLHINEETFEIVYAGKGTAEDYENLDVSGKFVLIDINQVEDWWINWPAYQASVKGAAGIIAVSSGGYATYTDDTLGVQDYCGPADVAALNISRTDGAVLKAAIEANGGSLNATMTVESTVTYNGTAYAIVCEMAGQDESLQAISLIGHYDGYFHAFEDNASGASALLGIAKAFNDSAYQPRRSLRFVFNPAEEWGFADSRYDWAAGAWVSTMNHPEWAQNTFMTIDIDGGVADGHAANYRMRVPYEFAEIVQTIGGSIEGNPLPGFKVSSPMWTWTEGWTYAIAGIPVIDSGMETAEGDGSGSAYHTSDDNEESSGYTREAHEYSIKLYGSLAIAFDEMRVRPTDYTVFFNEFIGGIDVNGEAADELIAAAKLAETASASLKERLEGVTDEDAETINRQLNKLFMDVWQKLYTIDWNESVQFVYEYRKTNVAALKAAIDALENGDAVLALDEYLWQIDLNWYAYDFDNETVEYFINQVLGDDAKNSWGTGYISSAINLYDIIQQLKEKSTIDGATFNDEIETLKEILALEEERLDETLIAATKDVAAIIEVIETIAK